MGRESDIETIIRQEQELVFNGFDEDRAMRVALDIRERVVALGKSAAIDVRLWDRRMFWFSMPGLTGDNEDWVRRKANVVQRFHKSTYRLVLEGFGNERLLPKVWGLPAADYVLAGGGFPLRVSGIGVVGAIIVSGMDERLDHGVIVEAICAETGADLAAYALPDGD